MSDGPHRGVRLRHWRKVLQKAANRAASPDEIAEAMAAACKRDMTEIPVNSLKRLLQREETNLFNGEIASALERLRLQNPGSSIANQAIDATIDAISRGERGTEAFESALLETCYSNLQSNVRNLEEHTFRQGGEDTAQFVRMRLEASADRVDKTKLVRESIEPSANETRPTKRSGIDQGPAL